jgi:hypothetical protein
LFADPLSGREQSAIWLLYYLQAIPLTGEVGFISEASMRVIGDGWLSRTIRTVESVMEQHGFVLDPLPPSLKLQLNEAANTWDKLLRRFNLLLCPK